MEKLPISVSMISGPEVSRIGRALESVAGWTSEVIVVLNQDAQDGTEEIALKFGAKVFREPWKGHIAQKNSSAAKATQDWVFNLDADEVVSGELRRDLEGFFGQPDKRQSITALRFPRLSWFCGRWIRHGDWYPDLQTRIWRRGQAQWGGIDPHDKLIVSGRVVQLHGDLQHFSADSINQRLQKIIPFSDVFIAQKSDVRPPGLFGLWLRPWWRFFRAYFIKRGFLDGWQGYYIARHTAFSTLVRYAKLREARLDQKAPTAD